MKNLKNKQILQILIMISIVAISVILFLFPKLIDYRYEYSYENIKTGKEQVESLNNTLVSNEATILHKISELEELKKERDKVLREESQIGINESDFILDIPSILITLEQNALGNNVELSIDYNAMVTNSNSNPSQDNYSDETEDVPSASESEETLENEDDTAEERTGDDSEQNKIALIEENKEGNDDKEILSTATPNIEGIDVTVIPISISGSYSRVRDYIKYLDEVGMIEPSSVTLKSEGDKVTSSVVLNVFHGKEGQ